MDQLYDGFAGVRFDLRWMDRLIFWDDWVWYGVTLCNHM